MEWYKERVSEISKKSPIYSCCGDDCAVCPRYIAATEEELEQITPDNYSEFVETLANRQGGRLWSGRVSPVFGVNTVNRAYDGVDPETIRQLVRAARPREK